MTVGLYIPHKCASVTSWWWLSRQTTQLGNRTKYLEWGDNREGRGLAGWGTLSYAGWLTSPTERVPGCGRPTFNPGQELIKAGEHGNPLGPVEQRRRFKKLMRKRSKWFRAWAGKQPVFSCRRTPSLLSADLGAAWYQQSRASHSRGVTWERSCTMRPVPTPSFQTSLSRVGCLGRKWGAHDSPTCLTSKSLPAFRTGCVPGCPPLKIINTHCFMMLLSVLIIGLQMCPEAPFDRQITHIKIVSSRILSTLVVGSTSDGCHWPFPNYFCHQQDLGRTPTSEA